MSLPFPTIIIAAAPHVGAFPVTSQHVVCVDEDVKFHGTQCAKTIMHHSAASVTVIALMATDAAASRTYRGPTNERMDGGR